MPSLLDQPARDAIATHLDDTLVVEAAAGTGKTTELVNRILRILATGRASVGQLVAVTFTEKAAGELKLRLREALERERGRAKDAVAREALDAALTNLEEAHVSTIHGFCADLLRERPVEARVDPLFTVLTETQAERLFDEAFGAWLQEQLANPPEGVRRALRRSSAAAGFFRPGTRPATDGPIDRLRSAAFTLAGWRDFSAQWTRRAFDRDGDIDRLVAELHEFAALTESPSYAKDTLYLDTAPARHLSAEIALQQSLDDPDRERSGASDEARAERREPGGVGGPRHSDIDGWEARLADLSRHRDFSRVRHGRGPGYRQGVTRAAVVDALDRFKAHLDQFRMNADADLAAALQQELRGAIERYEALKARAGALDFLDLLLKARDLIRGNELVRRGFQSRFTHIFVDEFQDTDPLQAEILMLLAAADPSATDWRAATPVPGRLFVVGDPKQSIYRFRRADVGIYREVCDRLVRCGATLVHLTTSFRGVPELQACINAAFAPVMTGDSVTLQAAYVPLAPFRSASKGQPAVVALPVPRPYGTRNISAWSIEDSLPDATGALVEWIVDESNWKVTERSGGKPVPVAAKHICLLFRRFLSFGEDVTQPYVQALEARGIPHVLVGGKTFHDREEVEAIRAALAAIEWPDDELSVFATLRGPLFAIGDEELLEWKYRFAPSHTPAFHPFRVPADADGVSHLQPIARALRALRRLHQRRNYIPVADTIQQLLDETRAHVGLVLRSGGEQALANVLHVAELARQYEAEGGISFRGFVEELRRAADRARAAEAPILEEGSDGVRIMTVHKAKGLEFPIVVLADLTCRLSRTEAGRWIDPEHGLCALKLAGWSPIDLLLHDAEEAARDKAESERLAYVAATRARDVLVIPAVGDGAYEGGWLDPLNRAVYPPEGRRRDPGKAVGCAPFRSKDTVVNRPNGDPASAATIAPGSHEFKNGSAYSVVWWDPHVLNLGAASSFGLRRDDLIVKDGDMFAVEERLSDYERWARDRMHVIETASEPGVRVQTATAWAAQAAKDGVDAVIADSADITVVALAGAEGRPRGPRFGTLVHAVLATVPMDASADVIETTAKTQARMLVSVGDEDRLALAGEVRAAVVVVRAVLAHELMDRARRAQRTRRETPVSWIQKDGTLIEGVLDLAFDEGGATTVVDFKTDHELAAGEARYRAQLQQYVNAVSRATGRPASGVLFRV